MSLEPATSAIPSCVIRLADNSAPDGTRGKTGRVTHDDLDAERLVVEPLHHPGTSRGARVVMTALAASDYFFGSYTLKTMLDMVPFMKGLSFSGTPL